MPLIAGAAVTVFSASILPTCVDQLPDGRGAAERYIPAQPLHLGQPRFSGLFAPGRLNGREHRHGAAMACDCYSFAFFELRQLCFRLECAYGFHMPAKLVNQFSVYQQHDTTAFERDPR